jgi:hypothetical protein
MNNGTYPAAHIHSIAEQLESGLLTTQNARCHRATKSFVNA